jgi:hypothetical protein
VEYRISDIFCKRSVEYRISHIFCKRSVEYRISRIFSRDPCRRSKPEVEFYPTSSNTSHEIMRDETNPRGGQVRLTLQDRVFFFVDKRRIFIALKIQWYICWAKSLVIEVNITEIPLQLLRGMTEMKVCVIVFYTL